MVRCGPTDHDQQRHEPSDQEEGIAGSEVSRDLLKLLPTAGKSLRTVFLYKKVDGHPDPGVDLTDQEALERDDYEVPAEEARLIDQRARRGLDEVAGRKSKSPAPTQRSRAFGSWVAAVASEWGNMADR